MKKIVAICLACSLLCLAYTATAQMGTKIIIRHGDSDFPIGQINGDNVAKFTGELVAVFGKNGEIKVKNGRVGLVIDKEVFLVRNAKKEVFANPKPILMYRNDESMAVIYNPKTKETIAILAYLGNRFNLIDHLSGKILFTFENFNSNEKYNLKKMIAVSLFCFDYFDIDFLPPKVF